MELFTTESTKYFVCKFCGNIIKEESTIESGSIYCSHCDKTLKHDDVLLANLDPVIKKLNSLSPAIIEAVKTIGLQLLDVGVVQVNREDPESVKGFSDLLRTIGTSIVQSIINYVKEQRDEPYN
jgi:hypothetical protein